MALGEREARRVRISDWERRWSRRQRRRVWTRGSATVLERGGIHVSCCLAQRLMKHHSQNFAIIEDNNSLSSPMRNRSPYASRTVMEKGRQTLLLGSMWARINEVCLGGQHDLPHRDLLQQAHRMLCVHLHLLFLAL